MNSLLELDTRLLLFINHDLKSDFLTIFFQNITDLHKAPLFIILILLSAIFVIYKYKKQGTIAITSLIITLMISDSLSYRVIKQYVQRLRPAVAGVDVEVRAPAAGDLSFTSNHAANIFAFAIFVGFLIPRARIPLFILAFLIALSRVYLGVHYPLDVICGGLLGAFAAFIGIKIYQYLQRRFLWPKS